jgi:hypothetical protein
MKASAAHTHSKAVGHSETGGFAFFPDNARMIQER